MINIKNGLFALIFSCMATTAFANQAHTDSPYRKAGPFVFISSQVPIDPATGKVSSEIEDQVKTVLANLQAKVIESGATMDDVVKLTVYMSDIDAIFPVVKQYIPYYFNSPYPARSPMGNIAFPKQSGFKLVIDAIVYIKS